MPLQGLFALALFSLPVSALSWNATKYFFAFGDSYTADGYNVSQNINFHPEYTSSNGPNWIEYLTNAYNQTPVDTFNLAYGGATIDSTLVVPYKPTVLSIVDQVSEFNEYLASKPAGAQWNSTNAQFMFWIGINDLGNSYYWTNVSQPKFHSTLMTRLFSQVDNLYDKGARNFLFLTVPPIHRAPLFVEQGSDAVARMKSAITNYNSKLKKSVRGFQESHADIGSVIVFDTQPVFNVLLDEWKTFGFVNVTGYCEAYQSGTPTQTYQVDGCAPVSSYFWLNSLHPLFTVHDLLAKAISTVLAGY